MKKNEDNMDNLDEVVVKEGDSETNENLDLTNKKTSRFSKIKRAMLLVLKVASILSVIFFAAYMYKYRGNVENPILQLSNQEIIGDSFHSVDNFSQGESVYFRISRKEKFGKNVVIVQIDKFDKDVFKYYKKITFEIDSTFNEIKSMIGDNYFTSAGKYRIKILIDGFSPLVHEITIDNSQKKM